MMMMCVKVGIDMKPYKETLIESNDPFPVDVFIRDNSEEDIISESHWCVNRNTFISR